MDATVVGLIGFLLALFYLNAFGVPAWIRRIGQRIRTWYRRPLPPESDEDYDKRQW